MYQSHVGKIEEIDGVACVVTARGEVGVAVFGPHTRLEPGCYEVEFHVMPHELNGRICCFIDILRAGRVITTERDLRPNELIRRGGLVALRFEVVVADTFEYRVRATGHSGLTIKYNRPIRSVPDA